MHRLSSLSSLHYRSASSWSAAPVGCQCLPGPLQQRELKGVEVWQHSPTIYNAPHQDTQNRLFPTQQLLQAHQSIEQSQDHTDQFVNPGGNARANVFANPAAPANPMGGSPVVPSNPPVKPGAPIQRDPFRTDQQNNNTFPTFETKPVTDILGRPIA